MIQHAQKSILKLVGLLGLCLVSRLPAQDWPQFHGPDRNLKTTSINLNLSWPGGEPPVLWQKKIGNGWSGPVVADGKLILHDRVNNREVVTCYDAITGDRKWEYRYFTSYRDQFGFDSGPRATPTISGDHVYTFGAEGRLSCLNFADGSLIWSVDTKKKFRADKGFFGLACSPMVHAGRVLVQIGGSNGHGIMAFNAKTGEVSWSTTDHEAGYSSPVPAKFNNRHYALLFTRDGLTAVDPATGFIEFDFPWRARDKNSVNAASPVIMGDQIFISASYGLGAMVLRVTETGATPFWQGDDKLSNHYATSIFHDHMLFGFHGRVDTGGPTDLRAVDSKNGKVLWQMDMIAPGTLMLVNNTLLVLTQDGKLYAGAASPKGFKPAAQAQIIGKDTRAHPAFANGIFYARDKGKLVALDLRKDGKQP